MLRKLAARRRALGVLPERTYGRQHSCQMIASGGSISSAHCSPLSYGNRIGRGRHDETALSRAAPSDEACVCARYTFKPFEP